jgi:hypothetical protein
MRDVAAVIRLYDCSEIGVTSSDRRSILRQLSGVAICIRQL